MIVELEKRRSKLNFDKKDAPYKYPVVEFHILMSTFTVALLAPF